MKFDWSCGALADGLRCYESEEFFLAHEHWESVWLKCEGPERSFLQALIQMAGAFHHLRRDNYRGAASLLNRALRRLEGCPAIYESVEVAPLRVEVGEWLRRIEAQELPILTPFPQIRFVPSTKKAESPVE
jgi:predicted metal-dependent hydrolase